MTAIASRVAFRHKCDIYRNTGAADSHGGRSATWTVLAAAVQCLGWEVGGNAVIRPGGAAPGEFVVLGQRRLILPKGTDVTEKDQIRNVKDRLNADVFKGNQLIEAVLVFTDRVELVLQGVNS